MADSTKPQGRPQYIGPITADEVRRAACGYDRGVTDEHLNEAISPPGRSPLPIGLQTRLIEQRRIEYLIPDAAFDVMPASDTVYVWQMTMVERKGLILQTDNQRDYERNTAPSGIIVGAGLLALDQLRSHGIDLGHIVRLLRLSPFRMECCYVGPQARSVLVMHAGDIKGSEDTMRMLRSGELILESVEEDGPQGYKVRRHVYRTRAGTLLNPVQPWSPEEI